MFLTGVGPRVRGPHRPAIGDDSWSHENSLRGRVIRVRCAVRRGVPSSPAAMPLSLLLHRQIESEFVRRWKGEHYNHLSKDLFIYYTTAACLSCKPINWAYLNISYNH